MILTATMITILAVLGVLLLAVLLAVKFYTVVEPNKAHVVVAFGGGRKIYHPAMTGKNSAYFFIPLFMKRIIVSLENVKHEINEIELRDNKFAPFQCDITCWFKIANPDFAAEKLDVDSNGNIMDSIRETLNAQVQGVVRAAAMKQEIMELMQDRTTFGKSVFEEVNGDLDEWGVQLVKLEIIDFSDMSDSHVIQDYEARRESEISSATRQTVAKNDQEAKVKEAEALKISETAKIEANQTIQMRDIERSETTGIRNEQANIKVAEQKEVANEKTVNAERKKIIGQAQYTADSKVIIADGDKLAKVKLAEGEKEAAINKAEGEAKFINVTGTANAKIIEKTGTAEATAVEKKAEAQKKFQDASKDIEMAKIAADIKKTQFTATAEALKNAKIQVISKDMSFMGFGAEQGAGLGTLLNNLKDGGLDLQGIIESLSGKGAEKETK